MLKELLIRWQFWALGLQLILVAATTIIECRRLAVERRTLIAAGMLGIAAWIATATLPPRTSRIFYDEQIYQGVAHNLSDLRLAQMCNEGVVEYGRLQCTRGEYNKEPYGYPYLLSLVYRAGGVSDAWAFRFNNLVAGLAVFVAVMLTSLLFADPRAALFSGLIMMVLPMQLTWSNTAAAEPSAALFCGAAVLSAVHFARVRTTTALAWAVAVSAFAVTFRPECILVLPVVGLAILFLAPDEFRRPPIWWAALAGLALVSVSLLHLAAVGGDGWGASGSRMSWTHAVANAPTNFWFYVGDERFPAAVTAAALIGLAGTERLREPLFLAAYFLVFWTVFVFFYAGSYNYGADVRYSLMTYLPLAVLGGAGLSSLVRFARDRWLRDVPDALVSGGVAAALAAQSIFYLPIARATGEEAWAARADVRVAKEFVAALPPNSIVLTHNPSMFHLWGVNAAQLSIAATEPEHVDRHLLPRFAGGVYLHWNFWCNVDDPVQVGVCRAALETFPHERVDSRRERTYEYALYRLGKR